MAETPMYNPGDYQTDVNLANDKLKAEVQSIYEQSKAGLTKGLTPEEQTQVDSQVASAKQRYEQAVKNIGGRFAFASEQADVLAQQSQAAQQAAVGSMLEATRQQLGRAGAIYQPMAASGVVNADVADTQNFIRQTGAANLAFQAGEQVGAAAGAQATPFSGAPSTTFAGQEISAGMGQTGRLRVSADIYQNALRAAEASGLSRAEAEGAAAQTALKAAAQDEALRRYTQQLRDIEGARTAGLTQAAQFGAQSSISVSENLLRSSENELNRRADQISQERQFANQSQRDQLDREFQGIQAEKNRRNALALQNLQDRAALARTRASSGAGAPTALEAAGTYFELGQRTRLGAFLPLAAGSPGMDKVKTVTIKDKKGIPTKATVNVADAIYNATLIAGQAAGLPASQRRAIISDYINRREADLKVIGPLLGIKDVTIDSLLQWTETARDFTGAVTSAQTGSARTGTAVKPTPTPTPKPKK